MVNKFLKILRKDFRSLHQAAFLLGLSAVASQVLALIRDRLFAATFGAGRELDIYYAAFRIPDMIYVIVASVVSAAVLIPFVVEKRERGQDNEVRRLLGSILFYFLVTIFAISLIAFFTMPLLAPLIVPGFDVWEREVFVHLSRILLLSPIFLGISNLLGSITQSLRRFSIFAFTPVVYNIGIIIGVLFFYPYFGIAGLALGVVFGAFLHGAIQVPVFFSSGYARGVFFPPFIRPSFEEVRRIIRVSLPRTLALSSHHLVILIFTVWASQINDGAISIFSFAYNLQAVPLAVVGVSYSVAAFPTLSRLFANGNKKDFVAYILAAARHIIFWSLPVTALFVVLRAHIVRVILGGGLFDWDATRLTAAALALFVISLVAQGLNVLLTRGYYAMGNTRIPLIANVVGALFSVVFGLFLLSLFSSSLYFRSAFENMLRVEGMEGTSLLMLPLAFSGGNLCSLLLMYFSFQRLFQGIETSMVKDIYDSLVGAFIAGSVSYALLNVLSPYFPLDTFTSVFAHGFVAGLGGIFSAVVYFERTGNREYLEIRRALTKSLFAQRPVSPDMEEL